MMRGLVLAFLTAIAVGLPGSAGACACGEVSGPIVAQGRSPHHVPWVIRVEDDSSTGFARFEFDLEKPAFPGVGYGTSLPLPIPDQFVFTADSGSDLSRFPESDISGITSSRVAALVVSVGRRHKPLRIAPQSAPAELYTSMPWLQGLRFFDRFFSSKLTPKVATAFDASGNVLARIPSNRGLF
jgi:hypothetical protein